MSAFIRCRFIWLLLLLTMTSGCGGYAARRIVQAPNRYPSWLAPQARVILAYDEALATNLPSQFVEVGPPEARLRYRVVPPGNYQVRLDSTNRMNHGNRVFEFSFSAKEVPGATNAHTLAPRGTVVLLHGYGLGDYAMLPWALRLADDGWQCVLVDLRGHGKSTGKQISYGIHEVADLSQLLDALERKGGLVSPVGVVGVSYGASLGLRWKTTEARVGPVVAIAPYAVLSNAMMNICHEYASCLPAWLPRAGMKHVPELLGVEPGELDPVTMLERHPVKCLLVAASDDKVTSATDMQRLGAMLAPGSRMVAVPKATHETLTYHFKELVPPVLDWLGAASAASDRHGIGLDFSLPDQKEP